MAEPRSIQTKNNTLKIVQFSGYPSKCHIPVGAELEYINDKQIKCKVIDDRKIEYNGKAMYLTGLAKILLNKKVGVCGPLYFNYKGKNLQRYYEEYQR